LVDLPQQPEPRPPPAATLFPGPSRSVRAGLNQPGGPGPPAINGGELQKVLGWFPPTLRPCGGSPRKWCSRAVLDQRSTWPPLAPWTPGEVRAPWWALELPGPLDRSLRRRPPPGIGSAPPPRHTRSRSGLKPGPGCGKRATDAGVDFLGSRQESTGSGPGPPRNRFPLVEGLAGKATQCGLLPNPRLPLPNGPNSDDTADRSSGRTGLMSTPPPHCADRTPWGSGFRPRSLAGHLPPRETRHENSTESRRDASPGTVLDQWRFAQRFGPDGRTPTLAPPLPRTISGSSRTAFAPSPSARAQSQGWPNRPRLAAQG